MAVLGLAALGVVGLAACGVALQVLPPIEFPPGDYQTVSVHNDTSTPVVVFDCDNTNCQRGTGPTTVAPGQTVGLLEDLYTPGPIGLADPTTHGLLGCMTNLPHAEHTGDDVSTAAVRVSAHSLCPGDATPGLRVTFIDPSK